MRGLGMGGGLGKGFGKALGGGGLGKLVADLSRQRKAFEAAMKAGGLPTGVPGRRAPSKSYAAEGNHRLRLQSRQSPDVRLCAGAPAPSPAMVVVLHGCTQTAGGYDFGAGWSTLADRYGFVLVSPEQQAANNPKTASTGSSPAIPKRDKGEALSIRQMVDARLCRPRRRRQAYLRDRPLGGRRDDLGDARDYPEVFAGGAIIAGLPYGAAG